MIFIHAYGCAHELMCVCVCVFMTSAAGICLITDCTAHTSTNRWFCVLVGLQNMVFKLKDEVHWHVIVV